MAGVLLDVSIPHPMVNQVHVVAIGSRYVGIRHAGLPSPLAIRRVMLVATLAQQYTGHGKPAVQPAAERIPEGCGSRLEGHIRLFTAANCPNRTGSRLPEGIKTHRRGARK